MTPPLNTFSAQLLDRFEGVLLASALGDALGAGYEFAPKVPRGHAHMIGGGLGNFAPGEWTDDSSMALGILAALSGASWTPPLAFGDMPASQDEFLDQIATNFLAWFAASPPDVGIHTSQVLNGYQGPTDIASARKLAWSAFQVQEKNTHSAGNGALMRTAPLALVDLPETELAILTRKVAALTHAHSLAGDSAVLWTLLVRRAALTGVHQDPRELLGFLGAPAYWERMLTEAETAPLESFTPNGFTVTALQAAWAAIRACDPESPSFVVDVLQAAISIGDDTDTVAAIAGAYAGALKGAGSLPLDLVEMLHGLPGFRATDLTRMGLRLIRQDDESGWPAAPLLTPYYAKSYYAHGQPHYQLALAADPDLVIGSVAALLENTSDATVSLCRIGLAERKTIHNEIRLVDKVGVNANTTEILLRAARAIHFHRSLGRSVFLHCVEGRSRTPAVAAIYVAHKEGITPLAALAALQAQRQELDPNPEFLEVLRDLSYSNSWRW